MTRTEERLADALGAAAQALREDTMRPLIVPARRPRRLSWAAPVASAAGLLLVVGLAVAIAGQLRGSGRITSGAPAPHPYYVEADRNGDLPQVRSTATGTVTATLQVPHVRNQMEPALVAAAGNGVFFAAVAQRAGDRLYRFRLTETGQITAVNALPLPGNVLASSYWDVHAMAASPDGRWLAFAMTYTGPAGCEPSTVSSIVASCRTPSSDTLYAPGPSDNVAIVNTATGQKSAWNGVAPAIDSTFSVPSLSWSANSRSVNFIVRQCPRQGANVAEACTSAATGDSSRSARIFQIDRRSGSGHLHAWPLRRLEAFYSYLPQALISPDGSTMTAVLTPQLAVAPGSSAYVLQVVQIAVATQKWHWLYQQDLAGIPVNLNDVPYAALSTDPAGQHWLFSVGYCASGRCGGFNGWIDHGRLMPLQPADGSVASEAW